MKKFLLFYTMLIVGFLLMSCESTNIPMDNPTNVDTIIIGTGDSPGEYIDQNKIYIDWGPYSCLTIVKFYQQGYENNVIIQHPIKKYDGIVGCYEYYTNQGLYLNILPKQCTWDNGCSMLAWKAEWADSVMNIAGTSPYIPLSKGYYLVDWKWHEILPVSALAKAIPNAYYDNFSNHIHEHVFMTDMQWSDVADLTSEYSASCKIFPIKGIGIIRVRTAELACYFNNIDSDPFVCWNMSIYGENGMCYDNAYMYYKYGDCSPAGRTHLDYIHYCDSLQSIYQKRLIELINKDKLMKVGF